MSEMALECAKCLGEMLLWDSQGCMAAAGIEDRSKRMVESWL